MVSQGEGDNARLLLQNFDAQQIISNKFILQFKGDTFRRLVEPAFSINTRISAVIHHTGEIRFKSYSQLRRIIDITSVFREATNQEIGNFCEHASLHVESNAEFLDAADEGIRKQISALRKTETLNEYTVLDIHAKAVFIGFNKLVIENGKIVMPKNRREIKEILSFLLDKVYKGPITDQLLITNSTRPLE